MGQRNFGVPDPRACDGRGFVGGIVGLGAAALDRTSCSEHLGLVDTRASGNL
jgi:hypothetical protein